MKASLIVVLIVQKPLSVPNPGLDIFLQRIRQERMSNECLELEMITDEEDYFEHGLCLWRSCGGSTTPNVAKAETQRSKQFLLRMGGATQKDVRVARMETPITGWRAWALRFHRLTKGETRTKNSNGF